MTRRVAPIRPVDVLPFVAAQLPGAAVATGVRWLVRPLPAAADDVSVSGET